MITQKHQKIESLREYNSIRKNLMELVSAGVAQDMIYNSITYWQDEVHVLYFDKGYGLRVLFDNSTKTGNLSFFGPAETLEKAFEEDLPKITKQE